MVRQGSQGFALVASVGLWLTGCAALGVAADPTAARLAETLDRDAWRVDPQWSADGAAESFRWRFAAPSNVGSPVNGDAEAFDRDALRSLAKRPGRVGWNATILLARAAPPAAAPSSDELRAIVEADPPHDPFGKLTSLVHRFGAVDRERPVDDRPPETTRAAAAEIWCRLLAAGDGTIETHLAEPGRLWRRTDLPDIVRAELIRGLARRVSPSRIVGFESLFPGDPSALPIELRRAAIEGCVLFAAGRLDRRFDPDDWPATIENARSDPDASVRSGYGLWLAAARPPDAVVRLRDQTRDSDPSVANAAVRALGRLGTDEARDALRSLAGRHGGTLRASAVEALAAWGPSEMRPYLADDSPHVRRAAVSGLAQTPSAAAAVLLDAALADSDLDMQSRAVAATRAWPEEFALPVLLSGLQNAASRTRRECLDELRRRSGLELPFDVTAERTERLAAVRELALSRGWPLDALTQFRLAAAEFRLERDTAPSADVVSTLQKLTEPSLNAATREKLLAMLRDHGPSAAPAVEAFCIGQPGPAAETLRTEVLPAISPAHAALVEVMSDDVAVRRRGAGRLAELSRTETLRPLVLRRLYDALTREQDGLVWRQALTAVADDATADAERIALLALHNSLSDVRRLACEHVGRHGGPPQALPPLLADANDSVRLAAIEAAGRCGAAAATESLTMAQLRAAAADPSRTVRFAAATALAELGDEQGRSSLVRWAEHEPPAERIRALQSIRSTGQPKFVSDLSRLAATEVDPLARRELLDTLETLVPQGDRPDGTETGSPEDRLAAWAARWEGPASSSTMAPPSGGTP